MEKPLWYYFSQSSLMYFSINLFSSKHCWCWFVVCFVSLFFSFLLQIRISDAMSERVEFNFAGVEIGALK